MDDSVHQARMPTATSTAPNPSWRARYCWWTFLPGRGWPPTDLHGYIKVDGNSQIRQVVTIASSSDVGHDTLQARQLAALRALINETDAQAVNRPRDRNV